MTIEVEIAGTGQVAEFPDGTPPEVIQQALSQFQGGQNGVADPSGSASNVAAQSSAQAPGSIPDPAGTASGAGVLDTVQNAALEFMAGVNRGAISVADIPADIINAVSQLSGAEFRAPTLREQDIVQQGTAGGFVEDPKDRLSGRLESLPPLVSLWAELLQEEELLAIF